MCAASPVEQRDRVRYFSQASPTAGAGQTYVLAVNPYGWIPHNASFGFLDLAPSILHSNWFWDYIS
jgi:hypothetical protein